MFDDKERTGERLGERGSEEREERGEYADRWEKAMEQDDVPEFAGEWGYGSLPESGLNEVEATIAASWDDLVKIEPTDLEKEWQDETGQPDETERSIKDELVDAGKITSYGFDTASRLYGLESVIEAIVKTDETINNAENPLGAVYQTLEPKVEERAHLYNEIQKDRVKASDYNEQPDLNSNHSPLGFSRSGNFYDKTKKIPGKEQESVEAIRAVRRLMRTLENDERFDALREQAYERDQTIIEHLMEEIDHPTVTQLLDNINAEVADEMVDEILDQAELAADEQEAGPEETVAEVESLDRAMMPSETLKADQEDDGPKVA